MKVTIRHVIISIAVLVVASLSFMAINAGTGSDVAAPSDGIQDAEIRMYNTPPVRPLIPGDTSEWGGGRLINLMFTGLVAYNLDDASPYNAMAESIETTDSKVFTIKIKKGWRFHDGTEVKAHNFVNAWNYTAYGPNKQRNNTFLEKIEGYADLNPVAQPGRPAPLPTTDKLSGLRIINDYEFKATLSVPFSVFPTVVGYWAFYPLPDSFFSDHAGYLRHPIGNGPYKFVETKPDSHQKLLTAIADYRGAMQPRIKDLRYIEYPDTRAAYQALVKGELDFLEAVPYEVIVNDQYKTDVDGRYSSRSIMLMQFIAFPSYLSGYDNPDLHKAVSMAINRDDIIKKIGGTQRPADGFAIQEVAGYTPGQCGELCTYNPGKARDYLAKSGFHGTLELHTNIDSGARTWMSMVCQNITATLDVGCQAKQSMSFRDFRKAIVERTITGAYRSDWRMDYPSIENYLTPLYRTGASSNDSGYSNPEFDAALDEADRAPNESQANAGYQQAERILVKSMPTVPLWQEWDLVVWSPRLTNVKVDFLTDLDVFKVQVVDPEK